MLNSNATAKLHQPTNQDLWQAVEDLLSSPFANGVQCFLDLDNKKIWIELETVSGYKRMLGCQDNNASVEELEQQLALDVGSFAELCGLLEAVKETQQGETVAYSA